MRGREPGPHPDPLRSNGCGLCAPQLQRGDAQLGAAGAVVQREAPAKRELAAVTLASWPAARKPASSATQLPIDFSYLCTNSCGNLSAATPAWHPPPANAPAPAPTTAAATMKKNTFIPEAMRGVCFECGARGHFGRDCPVRKANDGRRGKKRVRFNPEEDVAEAADVDEGLEPRTAMDGDVDDDDDEDDDVPVRAMKDEVEGEENAAANNEVGERIRAL